MKKLNGEEPRKLPAIAKAFYLSRRCCIGTIR